MAVDSIGAHRSRATDAPLYGPDTDLKAATTASVQDACSAGLHLKGRDFRDVGFAVERAFSELCYQVSM